MDEIVVVSGIDEKQIEKKRLDRLSRTAVSTETRSESCTGRGTHLHRLVRLAVVIQPVLEVLAVDEVRRRLLKPFHVPVQHLRRRG